jgi:hypothetical protein
VHYHSYWLAKDPDTKIREVLEYEIIFLTNPEETLAAKHLLYAFQQAADRSLHTLKSVVVMFRAAPLSSPNHCSPNVASH